MMNHCKTCQGLGVSKIGLTRCKGCDGWGVVCGVKAPSLDSIERVRQFVDGSYFGALGGVSKSGKSKLELALFDLIHCALMVRKENPKKSKT